MTGNAHPAMLALDDRLAGALQLTLETILHDSFQIPVKLETWSIGKMPLTLDSYVACLVDMKETDQNCGALILAFHRELLVKILRYYGVTETPDQKSLDDAAEEITNMVYGMIKTVLNKMGHQLVMQIPVTVHEKQDVKAYENIEKMILPFLADGHRCRAVVAKSI